MKLAFGHGRTVCNSKTPHSSVLEIKAWVGVTELHNKNWGTAEVSITHTILTSLMKAFVWGILCTTCEGQIAQNRWINKH